MDDTIRTIIVALIGGTGASAITNLILGYLQNKRELKAQSTQETVVQSGEYRKLLDYFKGELGEANKKMDDMEARISALVAENFRLREELSAKTIELLNLRAELERKTKQIEECNRRLDLMERKRNTRVDGMED